MPANWSDAEVEAAVDDYFSMLRLELEGQKYNKTEHREALIERLNDRSNGSVELKHRNISAVLIEMGIPYINGYKPLSNYQHLLIDYVSLYLKKNPDLQLVFNASSEAVPTTPTVSDLLAAMEGAPEREDKKSPKVSEPKKISNPAGINYLEREAQNQALGDAGEDFVVKYEKARLIFAGKEALADQVEQVSVTEGPSAGYDIRSYEANGVDRFIEAKTTKYGKRTPFFITPNELGFSKSNSSNYFLYRVFKFSDQPKMFALHGYLEDYCQLKPSLYSAMPF